MNCRFLLSKAMTSADGPGSRWIFTARWGDDERIRVQMADIMQKQLGGGRQRTALIRATALLGRDGKHTAMPGKTRPVKS